MNKERELIVKKIRNGTVIDHIPVGKGVLVLRILGIGSDVEYYHAQKVESKKLGRKDIVKIVDRYPTKEEVDKISLIAPTATINYIREWEIVEKYKVKLPSQIEGFIKCPNRFCITNNEGGMKPKFNVLFEGKILLQCLYCDGLIKEEEIEKYVK